MENWSKYTQSTACVAAPHTLPVNYVELQNQRVGCVRYARTRLFDWRFAISTFNFVEASTFRRPQRSSESVKFKKVKTLNNKPFPSQHPNHKQKSYGALSQKLHCQRHILFHHQTRRSKIEPACRTYRLIACGLYGCAKTISLWNRRRMRAVEPYPRHLDATIRRCGLFHA